MLLSYLERETITWFANNSNNNNNNESENLAKEGKRKLSKKILFVHVCLGKKVDNDERR